MVKMIKRFTIAEYGVEWRVELAVRVGRYLVSFWDLDSGNRISPTFFHYDSEEKAIDYAREQAIKAGWRDVLNPLHKEGGGA